MRESLLKKLATIENIQTLYITGHSLGSGLATVAMPDILANSGLDFTKVVGRHYNFACPRVGDPVFTAASNASPIPTWRIVNTCDLVPEVPPSIYFRSKYEHTGTPVCFTAQYGGVAENHSMTDTYLYAVAHPDTPSTI